MAKNSIGTVNMKMVFNADEWVEGLRKADRELARTLKKMETETARTSEQLRRSMMQSTGAFGQSATQAALAERQAAILERERWQNVQGIGQQMVATRTMTAAQARAIQTQSAFITSMDKVTRSVTVGVAGVKLITATYHAWMGDIKKTKAALDELPPLIREAAEAGWSIGDPLSKRWTAKVFDANILGRGGTKQSEYLKLIHADELAAESARPRIEAYERETRILQAAADEQAFIRLRYDTMDKMRTAATAEEKQAIRRWAAAQESKLIDDLAEKADRAAQQELDHRIAYNRESARLAQERFQREQDWYHNQMEEVREYNRTIMEMDQARLRAAGRNRDAELLAIANHYAERIRLAKEAGRFAMAAKLEELAQLRMAEASMARPNYEQISGAYANVGGGIQNPQSVRISQQSLEVLKLIEQHTRSPVARAG